MKPTALFVLIVTIAGVGLVLAQPKDGLQVLATTRPEVHWSRATAVQGDFDCDGQPDQAFLGRAGGRVYVGVVRSGHRKPEVLDFAVNPGVQAAICAEPAVLRIESLDYNPAEAVGGAIPGFRKSKTCKGLRLEGGECDSIHFFWNHNTKRLEWWRA
jgi:hypothetical protein